MRRQLAVVLCAALLGGAAPVHAAERTFTVVIGNREPPAAASGATLSTLRYADDDAIRYVQLFGRLPGKAHLLTVMDRETLKRFPDLTPQGPPTLKALQAAIADVKQRAAAAQKAGERTRFVLVFSGHGAVRADGETFLAMLDGELTRDVLFDEIFAQLQADEIHVIIDACHAGGVVGVRGDANFDREIEATTRSVTTDDAQRWLHARTLARFPHVGVLAAASAGEKAHEWSEIEAGVFSHEVLSGLWGAADVNGDRRIEYSELQAFTAVANRAVDDPRAVPRMVAHAPAGTPHAVLVDLDQLRDTAWITGDASTLGRFYIELNDGQRVIDANLGVPTATIGVPTDRQAYLRTHEVESRLQLATGARADFGSLVLLPIDAQARGATDQAYRRGLFAEPFTVGYYRGYVDSIAVPSVKFSKPRPTTPAVVAAPVPAPTQWPSPDTGATQPKPRARPDPATRDRRAGIGMLAFGSSMVPVALVAGGVAIKARIDFASTDIERTSQEIGARHRTASAIAIAGASAAAVGFVVGAILMHRAERRARR